MNEKCDCKNYEPEDVTTHTATVTVTIDKKNPDPWDVEPYDAVYNENIGVTNPLYLQKRRIVKESISGMLFGDFNGEIMGCSHKNNLTPLPPYNLIPLTKERMEQLREWRESKNRMPYPGPTAGDAQWWRNAAVKVFAEVSPCSIFGAAPTLYVVDRWLEQPAVDEAKEFTPYAAVGNFSGVVALVENKQIEENLPVDRCDGRAVFIPITNPAEAHDQLHKLGFGGNPAPEQPVIIKRTERWINKHIKFFAGTDGQTAYVLAEPLQRYIANQKEQAGIEGGDDVVKVLDELDEWIKKYSALLTKGEVVRKLHELRAKYTEGES